LMEAAVVKAAAVVEETAMVEAAAVAEAAAVEAAACAAVASTCPCGWITSADVAVVVACSVAMVETAAGGWKEGGRRVQRCRS